MKRHQLDTNDLSKRYLEGDSVKALSERYGVSRNVISLRLTELGIEARGISQANRHWTARLGEDGRRRLTANANAARRSGTVSEGEVEAKALWREQSKRFASPHEITLGDWLVERGLTVEPQKAVGRYNLDLAVGAVAVELHRSSSNPARHTATRKRAHYILDRGWSMIYVWVNASFVLAERAADEVVAFTKTAEGLPAGASEYRVIRGTGEMVMSIRFKPNEVAVIPTPKAHLKTRREH